MQLNADTRTHIFTQLILSYPFTHVLSLSHTSTLSDAPIPTHTLFHIYTHHTLTHEHTAHLLPPHTCSHSHTPTHSLTHKDKHTLTPTHTPPPTHPQFLPSHRLCLRLKHGRNKPLYYRREDKAWEASWGSHWRAATLAPDPGPVPFLPSFSQLD